MCQSWLTFIFIDPPKLISYTFHPKCKTESQKVALHVFHPQIHLHSCLSEFPLETQLTWAKQAGRHCWPGKHSTVLCSMLAAAENTHRSEQMAEEEGDRLTDENCRGYPTWEISRAERKRERTANLNFVPVRLKTSQIESPFHMKWHSKDESQSLVKMEIQARSLGFFPLSSDRQTVCDFWNGLLSVKLWRSPDYRNEAGQWLPTEGEKSYWQFA